MTDQFLPPTTRDPALGPVHHRLKTWPEFFKAVADGRKKFELCKNERGFEPGDLLELVEYDPQQKRETGAAPIICKAGYILRGPCFGLEAGFCIIQIRSMS